MLVCPVCGDTKWVGAYKIDQWEIGECAVCRFARIDPLPKIKGRPEYYSQEEIIKRNTRQRTPLRRFFRDIKQLFSEVTGRNKSEICYKKLSRYLSPGLKVLDVGCGDGRCLKLAKRKFICTGIDISEYQADLAKKQGYAETIAGNLSTVDSNNEKYGGITLISFLEHLDDPLQAIKKCFDLLNNGGVLLIKTVNYGCLNRRITKERWTGFRPPDHVIYFTPANLKRLLKKIGFTKIKISAWAFNDNMYCDAWK